MNSKLFNALKHSQKQTNNLQIRNSEDDVINIKQKSVNNNVLHLSSSSISMLKHQLLIIIKKNISSLKISKDKSEEKIKKENENVTKKTLKINFSELMSRHSEKIQ